MEHAIGHVEAATLTSARRGSYHPDSMRTFAAAVLGLVLAGLPVEATARPLTLRRADRAIDLALQAELAGDHASARQALLELVRSSTTSASAAARARIRQWLRAMESRQASADGLGTAERYSAVIQSLAPFGLARVKPVWSAALADLPELRAIRDRQARIAVHPDQIIGVDREMNDALHKQLARTFGRHGLRIEFPDVAPELPTRRSLQGKAKRPPPPLGTYRFVDDDSPFELRLEVDATGRRTSGPRVEVEARASYILKSPGPEGSAIGRFARHRRETRRTELAARRFAVRQIGLDLAESVVVDMWVECLRQAATSGRPGFDSEADVRSN